MKSKNPDCISDVQWSCKTWRRSRLKVIRATANQLKRRREVSDSSYVQKKTRDPFIPTILRDFYRWRRAEPKPRRSETNVLAERAVRRLKEGTSSVLFQFGLQENWWKSVWTSGKRAEAMDC